MTSNGAHGRVQVHRRHAEQHKRDTRRANVSMYAGEERAAEYLYCSNFGNTAPISPTPDCLVAARSTKSPSEFGTRMRPTDCGVMAQTGATGYMQPLN